VLSVFKKDTTDSANVTGDITGIEGKEFKVSALLRPCTLETTDEINDRDRSTSTMDETS